MRLADAEILSSAVTNAMVGPDASVSVTNGITVDAHPVGDNNLATAKASGGAAVALVGAAVFKADAEDNGETVAEVDGAVTGANALTVTATGTNTRRRRRTRSGSAAWSRSRWPPRSRISAQTRW